jgi:HAD-superfamily hydrolase, subfamily IIB
MKDRVFVFDVDGTLTSARETIDSEFEKWFYDFCQDNDVYLVSGSDRPKTLEQVGQKIYDSCLGVYQCNGNEHWYRNRRVKSNAWKPSYELTHYLQNKLHHSKYPFKTDKHIEIRTGMINFSTVGRAANQKQRSAYSEWDKKYKEREHIADEVNRKFKDMYAAIGGQISVDIYPKGSDKSQVTNDLKDIYENIYFFGDRTEHGGNDYSIALVINLGNIGKAFQVDNWQHTWSLLKEF